jgi:hypothetical protein
MSWGTIFVFMLIWACLAAAIAHRKGQSVGGFFLAGLILGIFGGIWAFAMKPVPGQGQVQP